MRFMTESSYFTWELYMDKKEFTYTFDRELFWSDSEEVRATMINQIINNTKDDIKDYIQNIKETITELIIDINNKRLEDWKNWGVSFTEKPNNHQEKDIDYEYVRAIHTNHIVLNLIILL